ncbi:hypothetical protein NQ317_009093 [Molorchus minor]|uniref:Uncharacterized protein n=1 Tax=Molorchus minor TaxID=1323400 RepID=A0ABQ9JK93_9CUCU|nr:hypothetical protein NQ317_009093 [Molorchus minor]
MECFEKYNLCKYCKELSQAQICHPRLIYLTNLIEDCDQEALESNGLFTKIQESLLQMSNAIWHSSACPMCSGAVFSPNSRIYYVTASVPPECICLSQTQHTKPSSPLVACLAAYKLQVELHTPDADVPISYRKRNSNTLFLIKQDRKSFLVSCELTN